MKFEILLNLGGNTAGGNVQVSFGENSPSTPIAMTCTFNVPAGTPLTRQYRMRGIVNTSWTSSIIMIRVPSPSGGGVVVSVDNVRVYYRPDLTISGTECTSF
jgi:hypothetical protein